jgi:hypothetical protein
MFNPFGKKKKGGAEGFEPMGGPSFGPAGAPRPPERRIVPTDEVRALASRGVPEPDIIRTLKREGYATPEIDQAMKDALRSRVAGDFYRPAEAYEAQPEPPEEEEFLERGDLPRNMGYPGADLESTELPSQPFEPQMREPEMPEIPEGEYFSRPPVQRRPMPAGPKGGIDKREIEELAEVIIEEKLRDIKDRFREVDMRFQQVGRKIDSFSEEVNRMRAEKSGEIKGIENKIDGYSKSMDEVTSRMESMEKALRDSLSPMLESLRSLSELVKSLKEKSK